jgi:tetratricopeptide (TPR) repeat protein
MAHDPRTLMADAVRHLEQAVRLAPLNPRYAALLGEAFEHLGDAEAALAPLQSSYAQEPHPRTAWLLAKVLRKLDRPAEAEAFCTAAIDEAGGFARAWALRGELRAQRGDLRSALADFESACALVPGHPVWATQLRGLRAGSGAAAPPIARTEAFDRVARTEGMDAVSLDDPRERPQ